MRNSKQRDIRGHQFKRGKKKKVEGGNAFWGIKLSYNTAFTQSRTEENDPQLRKGEKCILGCQGEKSPERWGGWSPKRKEGGRKKIKLISG